MVYNKIKFSVKHNIFENKRWMNVFVILPINLSITQCANHFDHLGFLPKIATNHTVNLARSHTDT